MDGKAAGLTLRQHSGQQSAAKANEGYKPFTAKERYLVLMPKVETEEFSPIF